MKHHILIAAAFILILVLSTSSPLTFAYDDPKHCRGYNDCYTIGYRDGFSDAQNQISPAYACGGHSQPWCYGYNDGFRTGNGGSNNYYDPTTGQTASIDVHGDNNKIRIDQQSNYQVRDNAGFPSDHKENSGLSKCVILCFNSNIRIN